MLARSQHIPNIARSPRTVLHTCCDLSGPVLDECRNTNGALHVTQHYHEAIADPEVDAICLATTERLRLPLISAAAEAGKPVYCEKPVAATLEEMYEVQRVVRKAGIPFCAGHNRRSSPAMVDARSLRQHAPLREAPRSSRPHPRFPGRTGRRSRTPRTPPCPRHCRWRGGTWRGRVLPDLSARPSSIGAS